MRGMKQAAILIVLFLSGLTGARSDGPQLLRNNNFEQGYIGGIADGWADNSGWANIRVHYSPEKQEAHYGYAQKIDVPEFQSGAVQFIQGGIRIHKDGTYEVRLWLKGRLRAPIEVLLRKAGSPYTTYFSKTFKIDDTWREYVFSAISSADDPNALFMIRISSTGTLWVDEASLRESSLGISAGPVKTGNLIPNGSFEVGYDRWGLLMNESDSNLYEMPIELLNQKLIVDSHNSKISQSSLKIVVPPHGRALLTSPYVSVQPGRPYTLSLWLAADKARNVRIGMASGYAGQGGGFYKEVHLGREWKRYSFSAVLAPAPENAYYVLLETMEEGNIWVDGVQLQEGEVAPFTTRSPVEIGFIRNGVTSIYEIGDQAALAIAVSSFESGGEYTVSIKSYDYYGKATALWSGDISLVSGGLREITFSHPTNRPGYFRIVADVDKKGTRMDSAEMAIGVVRKPVPAPFTASPFGNHARFNEEGLGNAKKLGVSWLRMHPPNGTKWDVVEKNKGKYVFFDEPISLAKSLGFHILGSLDTTPRWASTAPSEDPEWYRYPPKDIEDWKKYVYTTVSHYKGIIDTWEVWNEPDGGFLKLSSGLLEKYRKPGVYTQLLKAAYEAAKAANPQAVIVGGVGTGQPPARWVEAIFSEGAYDYMDVLSFHFYTDGRPGDALDVPTDFYVNQVRAIMRKYSKGTEKPIWETESGIMYPETSYRNILQVWPGYRGSAQEASAYVVRNYVHLLASGVAKWFYYDMFTANRIDRTDATGLFEWDGSPRPPALAYANLAWIIGTAKYSRALQLGDAIDGEEFVDTNRAIDVVWTKDWSDSKKIAVTVPANTSFPRCTVYDIMGNVLDKIENKNKINVVAGKDPVYVVFTK